MIAVNKRIMTIVCLLLAVAFSAPGRAAASSDTESVRIWTDLMGAVVAEVLAATDSPARSGTAVPAEAERCQILLYELENATKFTAQVNTWRYERAPWRQQLRSAATVKELARAVAGYEASLQDGSLQAAWTERRAAWRSALADVTVLRDVTGLLLEMEASLAAGAVDQRWKDRREAWRAEVLAAGAATLPLGPAVSPVTDNPAVPTETIAEADPQAGELLLALEGVARAEYTLKTWRSRRANWQRQARALAGADSASALLAQLGDGYAPAALRPEWRTARRIAWRSEAAAARDRAAWSALLLELEENIIRQATVDTWPGSRGAWTARVAAYRDAAAGLEGAEISVEQFARLLLECEEAVLFSAQTGDWPGQRDEWCDAVRGARSAAELAPRLRQFADGLRAESLGGAWPGRRAVWRNAVAAGGLRELAERLHELAGLLRAEAVTEDWPARAPAWSAELAGGVAPADAAEPAADEAEQARTLAGLLRELEAATRETAQYTGWMADRRGWLGRLAAADGAVSLREPLREFAKSLRPAMTTDAWRLRRAAWLDEVAAADAVPGLAELLRELEKAMRWSATDNEWREARDGWLARVNALRGGQAAAPAAPCDPATVRRLTGLMTEFDQLILYRSQRTEWEDARGEWLAANRSAATLADGARQLLALEGSLRDTALDERWPGRREDWRSGVQSADSTAALAERLLALEQAVAWSAVDAGWRLRQPGWRDRVRQAAAE